NDFLSNQEFFNKNDYRYASTTEEFKKIYSEQVNLKDNKIKNLIYDNKEIFIVYEYNNNMKSPTNILTPFQYWNNQFFFIDDNNKNHIKSVIPDSIFKKYKFQNGSSFLLYYKLCKSFQNTEYNY